MIRNPGLLFFLLCFSALGMLSLGVKQQRRRIGVTFVDKLAHARLHKRSLPYFSYIGRQVPLHLIQLIHLTVGAVQSRKYR